MAGVGKSTTGRRVAERLGRHFVDLDGAVEAASDRTVAEIFAAEGEPGFRQIESRVLAEVLAATRPSVVATGGGVILDSGNRDLLRRRATTVWLRAEVSELVGRLRHSRVDRPLLRGDVAVNVAALDSARRSYYAEVADLVVDVDGLDRSEVVESVLAGLDDVTHGAELRG